VSNAHITVEVAALPNCDFDQDTKVPAAYDGKTKFGPWANMCERHFKVYGLGLGIGRGQKFVLKKED